MYATQAVSFPINFSRIPFSIVTSGTARVEGAFTNSLSGENNTATVAVVTQMAGTLLVNNITKSEFICQALSHQYYVSVGI